MNRTAVALVLGIAILTSAAQSRIYSVTGPDAGFVWRGQPVQFEYVRCLADPDAQWFEDGSARC